MRVPLETAATFPADASGRVALTTAQLVSYEREACTGCSALDGGDGGPATEARKMQGEEAAMQGYAGYLNTRFGCADAQYVPLISIAAMDSAEQIREGHAL